MYLETNLELFNFALPFSAKKLRLAYLPIIYVLNLFLTKLDLLEVYCIALL